MGEKMKKSLFILLCATLSLVAVEVGEFVPMVSIEGKNGGKLDGSAWYSCMLKGKVHTLFYVDPDERELNSALADALKEKGFDKQKVASIAIINLAATWIPNAVLETLLKKKQKQFPNTLYVKDKAKVLVKKWHLADDNSDILIFDQKGTLIYKKFGKLSADEIQEVIRLIQKHL